MNVPISAERVRALLGATSAQNAIAIAKIQGDPKQSIAGPRISLSGQFAVRITDDQVRDIKRRYRAGQKGCDIAKFHNVSKSMVSMIISGARKAYVQ